MKRNLGTLDRFALAAVFIYLYARSYWFYAESLPGGDLVALTLFVVLLIISSVVGFYPVYAPFGLCSTRDAKKGKAC